MLTEHKYILIATFLLKCNILIEIMLKMGFKEEDISKSLGGVNLDNIYATYMLLNNGNQVSTVKLQTCVLQYIM